MALTPVAIVRLQQLIAAENYGAWVKSVSEVDWSDVGIATAAGAVTGGVASMSTLAAARGAISVSRSAVQVGAGAGAIQANASPQNIANGEALNAADALASGIVGRLTAGIGQAAVLALNAMLNRLESDRRTAHIVESTLRGSESDAASLAVGTSSVGSNVATGLDIGSDVGMTILQNEKRAQK